MLHLRARWYSAETGTFLSVDPVESEPPYQYVRGNPVNRVDPSGLQPLKQTPQDTSQGFFSTPSGYFEGYVKSGTAFNCIVFIQVQDIVYDFNTGERALFEYTSKKADFGLFSFPLPAGVNLFDNFGGDAAIYAGYLWGFRRNFIGANASIDEYQGRVTSFTAGASLGKVVSIDIGSVATIGNPVKGLAAYGGVEVSYGANVPLDFQLAQLEVGPYDPTSHRKYSINSANQMANDVGSGVASPIPLDVVTDFPLSIFRSDAASIIRERAPDSEWGDPVAPPPPAPPPEPYDCETLDGEPAKCTNLVGSIVVLVQPLETYDLMQQRRKWSEENCKWGLGFLLRICPDYPPELQLPDESN